MNMANLQKLALTAQEAMEYGLIDKVIYKR